MFRNTVLYLTLQILASQSNRIAESQIIQSFPRSCTKFEHFPQLDVARYNTAFLLPTALQTSGQSTSSPKYTVNYNENLPVIWDKLVTNPKTCTTYDNNALDNYENRIRKYDTMVNLPNVVKNNYHEAQPEPLKRIDNNYNEHRQYKENINKNYSKKLRQRKERPVRNNNEQGKKHRKYRQSEEHSRKKKDNKPLGDNTFNYNVKDTNDMDVYILGMEENEIMEKIEKNLLNNEEKNSASESNMFIPKTDTFQNTDTISKDKKKTDLDKNQTTKENYKKRNNKNRNTRNSKPILTTEYQSNYFNHDEFNKYLQNIMAGNISSPYYFTNDIYPYIFDSFYKSAQEPTKSKNKNSNKRKDTTKKPNKANRNKEENFDTVIELSPTLHQATPVTITTGAGPKKDIYLNLKIKKQDLPPDFDMNSNMPENIDELHIQTESDDDFSRKPFTTKNMFNPTEDDDEYYPDFTLSNHAHLTSSEEEELKQIQKHRGFYENDWDFYADRVKSYVEQTNKKPYIKPYVSFDPDFINLSNKNEKAFLGDVNTNIETIYAPSRVANYGQTESKIQNNQKTEENFWFKEGDTTIVLSRSINE